MYITMEGLLTVGFIIAFIFYNWKESYDKKKYFKSVAYQEEVIRTEKSAKDWMESQERLTKSLEEVPELADMLIDAGKEKLESEIKAN